MLMEIFYDFFRLLMIHKKVSPEISTDIRLLQQSIIDILFVFGIFLFLLGSTVAVMLIDNFFFQ